MKKKCSWCGKYPWNVKFMWAGFWSICVANCKTGRLHGIHAPTNPSLPLLLKCPYLPPHDTIVDFTIQSCMGRFDRSWGHRQIMTITVGPQLTHMTLTNVNHDDVIKWKNFPGYWPFVQGIHRSRVNSPHKVQWRGALMFSLICARINGWVNNREAGDLRRHRAHYDVIVMMKNTSGVNTGIGTNHTNLLRPPWTKTGVEKTDTASFFVMS